MTSTLRISRQQLAAFLKNDHDAIRQFETLFNTVATTDPTATATEPEIVVETAAHEALARIERLERSLGLLELGPKSAVIGHNHTISEVTDFTTGCVLGRSRTYTDTYQSIASPNTIPWDDTVPQNTEGTQLLSLSYTPKSASSKIVVKASVHCYSDAGVAAILALFVDSGTDAVASTGHVVNSGATVNAVIVEFEYTNTSTAAKTFSLRAGPSAGTMKINGGSATRLLGGSMQSWLEITELT